MASLNLVGSLRHLVQRRRKPPLSPEVARELLRVSIRPQGWMTLFQFVFLNGGMAVYFGLASSPWRAAVWMVVVGAGSLVFVFTPQPLPAAGDADGIEAALRRHTGIVGVHAAAHGSAGYFLFESASFAQTQVLLAAIMLGMLVAFIEFVSRYRWALQLATVLLVLPTVIMMLLYMKGSLLIMAVLLGSGLPMMLVLVGRRCDVFEDLIQRQFDELRLRQTTQEALAQARLAQQDRLRFFAAANHDLRQPVMAIGIYAELLRRQLDDARTLSLEVEPALASFRPHVEALQSAQRGLDGLVGQLLDIDQLESGEAPHRLEPVRLLPVLSRQVQQHQASAVRDGARIVLRCPAHATVQGHPLQLERVVSNLLDNAVKFSPGGTILVACRRRRAGWRIEVRDSGVGIPPEAKDRVFRDFEQVANPERDQQRGHGLGLAIVQRIAAQLGTKIELRSAPGKGSTFAITLAEGTGTDCPVEERPRVAPERERPGALRVLVVEDDASLGASLAALLRSDGVAALVYSNAEEALEAVDAEPFDLALCDVRLPGRIDGFALGAAIEQRRPETTIVLMSADVDRSLSDRANQAGWTTLRKPVAPQALLTAVERVV